MSKDIKIFTACDHTINGKTYPRELCAKCLGSGVYLDIMFDNTGNAVTTDGNLKLQQEVLKAILDNKISNPFHLPWGSDVYKMPGHKNLPISKTQLEMFVREAVDYLKKLQLQEATTNTSVTDEEILGQIENIYIERVSVLGWRIHIQFTNQEKEVMTQSITV